MRLNIDLNSPVKPLNEKASVRIKQKQVEKMYKQNEVSLAQEYEYVKTIFYRDAESHICFKSSAINISGYNGTELSSLYIYSVTPREIIIRSRGMNIMLEEKMVAPEFIVRTENYRENLEGTFHGDVGINLYSSSTPEMENLTRLQEIGFNYSSNPSLVSNFKIWQDKYEKYAEYELMPNLRTVIQTVKNLAFRYLKTNVYKFKIHSILVSEGFQQVVVNKCTIKKGKVFCSYEFSQDGKIVKGSRIFGLKKLNSRECNSWDAFADPTPDLYAHTEFSDEIAKSPYDQYIYLLYTFVKEGELDAYIVSTEYGYVRVDVPKDIPHRAVMSRVEDNYFDFSTDENYFRYAYGARLNYYDACFAKPKSGNYTCFASSIFSRAYLKQLQLENSPDCEEYINNA